MSHTYKMPIANPLHQDTFQLDSYVVFKLVHYQFAIPRESLCQSIPSIYSFHGLKAMECQHVLFWLQDTWVPIVRLAEKLKLNHEPLRQNADFLVYRQIYNNDILQLGLLVDQVIEVAQTLSKSSSTPHHLPAPVREDYFTGWCLLNQSPVYLLDLSTLVNPLELAVMEYQLARQYL